MRPVSEPMKVGLVLSGGGAKGAYQVGVLKALVEMDVHIDVVAGASIGALNGAVLTSAPSLEVGAERLEKLWLTLAESTPLAVNVPGYLTLLLSAGLKMRGAAALDVMVRIARTMAQRYGVQLPKQVGVLDAGFLSDKPLQALMDEYLDVATLADGLPLYVAAYKSMGGLSDMMKVMSAELGFADTAESEFLHVQSLPASEQKDVLLASAAIPILFAPREVNDSLYSDGGQGGWQKQQGNTPIAPLLKAGCNVVIVTHLSDGSLWSRQDFPEAMILEVRPRASIARDTSAFGGAKDLLGFDSRKIPSWIDQGYRDTMDSMGRIRDAVNARAALRRSVTVLEDSESRNKEPDDALTDAMSKLR